MAIHLKNRHLIYYLHAKKHKTVELIFNRRLGLRYTKWDKMDDKALATEDEIKQYLYDSLDEKQILLLGIWIDELKTNGIPDDRTAVMVEIGVHPAFQNGDISILPCVCRLLKHRAEELGNDDEIKITTEIDRLTKLMGKDWVIAEGIEEHLRLSLRVNHIRAKTPDYKPECREYTTKLGDTWYVRL